jgi:hypothetical protein
MFNTPGQTTAQAASYSSIAKLFSPRRRKYPAPDIKRCDAVAIDSGERCRRYATCWRDGRQVCTYHFERGLNSYTCGDRVGAYRRVLARALGDVS